MLKFQKLWEQTLSVIHITLGETRSRLKESDGVLFFRAEEWQRNYNDILVLITNSS